jgi:hypothetical protein
MSANLKENHMNPAQYKTGEDFAVAFQERYPEAIKRNPDSLQLLAMAFEGGMIRAYTDASARMAVVLGGDHEPRTIN